eukprot:Phypoly_transcript_06879.p1 GENE.Phypoly_transcript_06879~~Phypoly_transcript_06879.p1  ORF type:complete len:516 (+),score=29.28 Phypoly_transcript_06879:56-1603(+)
MSTMLSVKHVLVVSLSVFVMVAYYFEVIPFGMKEEKECLAVLDPLIQRNHSCYPPEDVPLRSKFELPSELCEEYKLPDIPKHIAELQFGVDIPSLLPEDERNPSIIWDTKLVKDVTFTYLSWNTSFPELCTIPPTYQLLVEALFETYLPKNWKEESGNRVPCALVSFKSPEEYSFKSTLEECSRFTEKECFRQETGYGASLSILRYMPSIVFKGHFWIPPRFMWMLSRYRSPNSLWALELLGESLVYYPFASHPFYKKMVNFTLGYSRTDFDIPVIPRMYTFESDLRDPPPLVPLRERNGTALIFWMQSNCHARSNRNLIVERLQKYMEIDIFGECMKNRDIPDWAFRKYGNNTYGVKRALLENYPFVLTMENSITTDYVTEKFYQPLAHGSIPVYLGPKNSADFIPTKYDPDNPVYIDLRDWESLENLAFYLRVLASNETMWNRYHKWRQIPRAEREAKAIFFQWLEKQNALGSSTCTYCSFIHRENITLNPPPPTHFRKRVRHPIIDKIIQGK